MQFNQPDTLIPDIYNSLDWNRYSYTRYSPLKYTDPSGHRECDQTDRQGRCHYAPRKIMILACGDGMNANCVGDYSGYDGNKPLSQFEKDAYKNGYDEVVYFSADTYNNDVQLYAEALNNYMIAQGSDARFTMIGHSRGAAAVVWAANMFLENNAPEQINSVLLLDAHLRTEPGRGDSQDSIKNLASNGVSVISYNSLTYKGLDFLGQINLPDGSQTSANSFSHLQLATDQQYWVTLENTMKYWWHWGK